RRGVLLLHWPGPSRWKPWAPRSSPLLSRSALEETWWAAREAVRAAAEADDHHASGAWRDDGRCGPEYPSSLRREGE
ncbi:unnamed protein product, partial [Polarella glacialis]